VPHGTGVRKGRLTDPGLLIPSGGILTMAGAAGPLRDEDAMADRDTTTTPPGYMQDKAEYLRRMRRIEGQVKGIARMVDEEKYCIDILTQVSAVTKALQAVALGLLDDHLAHCVVDAAQAGGPEAEAKLREASEAVARLVRS